MDRNAGPVRPLAGIKKTAAKIASSSSGIDINAEFPSFFASFVPSSGYLSWFLFSPELPDDRTDKAEIGERSTLDTILVEAGFGQEIQRDW